MQYLILYIILLLISLPGIKFQKDGFGDTLSVQKNVNVLRGIFALFIIYTHCTLAYDNLPIILMPLRKVSTFGVGFFFILSGYGLALSYDTKNNYLHGFLGRKLSFIAVAAIISRVISEFFMLIFFGTPLSIEAILKDMNWYIYVLMLLYLMFYLIYKFAPSRLSRVLLSWAIVILITFVFLGLTKNGVPGTGRSYFISEWAFPFGITIYEYRKEIDQLIKKHILMLSVSMLVLMGITFIASIKAPECTAPDLIFHNLMLIPFYYFVFFICKYFVFDNKALRFLSRISFEIYLYQFMFLSILRKFIEPPNVMYFIFTVLFTITFAAVINIAIINKVKKLIGHNI